MNENLITQKKDIKPVRPEPASNRGQRKTRGGGVLFSSTLTVINSIGLIVLFYSFSIPQVINSKLVRIL